MINVTWIYGYAADTLLAYQLTLPQVNEQYNQTDAFKYFLSFKLSFISLQCNIKRGLKGLKWEGLNVCFIRILFYYE